MLALGSAFRPKTSSGDFPMSGDGWDWTPGCCPAHYGLPIAASWLLTRHHVVGALDIFCFPLYLVAWRTNIFGITHNHQPGIVGDPPESCGDKQLMYHRGPNRYQELGNLSPQLMDFFPSTGAWDRPITTVAAWLYQGSIATQGAIQGASSGSQQHEVVIWIAIVVDWNETSAS